MIWEPFILALVLGIIVSAGLYFAYLWPSVEPADEPVTDVPAPPAELPQPAAAAVTATDAEAAPTDAAATSAAAATEDATSPAP